jgi:hypothetical protein
VGCRHVARFRVGLGDGGKDLGELSCEAAVFGAGRVEVGLGPFSGTASGLTVKAGHYVGTSW